MYTLFIFRRDYRLIDNKGLIHAMKNYNKIIPIFIFTPEQITSKNMYISHNAIQFMIESLKVLDKDLRKHNSKLHLFNGDNITVLKTILKTIDVKNIVFNMDYTPYAIKRDNDIKELCESKDIACTIIEDYLLKDIGTFNKKDGNPYTIFTPFKNNALKHKIDKPINFKIQNLVKINKLKEADYIKYKINKSILIKGGRKEGLNQLNKVKNQKRYNTDRNTLSISTTHLSAYIKFGCISIREVYWKIRDLFEKRNLLISQVLWREFYFYICYYFPRVLKGKNYNKKYDKIKWIYSENNFKAWTLGKTGYPIVDAGMREMNKTGYMHNRARLITANFLNRMLGMDWRIGEQYYATQLTDYDPAVNNGNWQWIGSTGVDPKPYFQRLFNPWLQSKKSDKNAEYIKKWIPSLKDIPAKELHKWDEYYHKYDLKKLNYYKPIVNYKKARERSIQMYRALY
jgi:deoxyribodipyrimidine photo-lyase